MPLMDTLRFYVSLMQPPNHFRSAGGPGALNYHAITICIYFIQTHTRFEQLYVHPLRGVPPGKTVRAHKHFYYYRRRRRRSSPYEVHVKHTHASTHADPLISQTPAQTTHNDLVNKLCGQASAPPAAAAAFGVSVLYFAWSIVEGQGCPNKHSESKELHKVIERNIDDDCFEVLRHVPFCIDLKPV